MPGTDCRASSGQAPAKDNKAPPEREAELDKERAPIEMEMDM